MADKELSNEEIESFRKELSEIKADMMRKELEDIKKDRMRKELDELKRERTTGTAMPQKPVYAYAPAETRLSLLNLLLAALMLLIAGYLIGTVYGTDVAGTINSYIGGYSLPVSSDLIVAAIAVIFALFGAAVMTIVRK